jgi:hypothetical protein
MPWAILDTTIYIGHWGRGLYADTLTVVRQVFVVRHASVVLSELRRARTREARRLMDSLHRFADIQWEPTAADWWQAGSLIREVGDNQR